MNEMVTTCHVRHIFTPVNQIMNKICMQYNNLLNENNSIPQSVFAENNQMKIVCLLETNSIPF